MKPINFDASTCNPISSNCVIWQGPDIPIINLCSGDSISDVVYALALQLEEVMKQINVNSYDLSCFNITSCKPDDFTALLQFLIGKICELENINPPSEKSGGCPDCMVTVAQCLQTNGQQTMNLVEYVNLIAEKLCVLISQVAALDTRVTNLETAVNTLQNTPAPTLTVPPVNVTCASTSFTSNQVWIVVQEFINNYWCPFYQTTGTASELFSSLNPDCAYPVLVPAITPATTVAEAITNIWRVICNTPSVSITSEDTTTIKTTITETGTSSIVYNISSEIIDTGWHCLKGFDHYAAYSPTGSNSMIVQKPQVRRIGNVLHFKGQICIPLESATSPGTVLEWDYGYSPAHNTYEGETSGPSSGKKPYQGTGGVTVNSSGKILFNNGNSVIPTEVLPLGYSLDYSYSVGWKMAWRNMKTGSCATLLTTWANVAIGSDGSFVWGCLADLEESITTSCNPGAWSTSHLNYTVSNVTSGQKVTDFKSAVNVHDSASSGNQNAQPDFSTTETYPITINANDPDEIGGFIIIIDGLTAFIGPCVTTIPAPTLDTNACNGLCPGV